MSNPEKNPVFKMKIDNLEIVSDGNVPSDYLDFEPIAPDESDIAEELGLLGTYIDF